MEGRDPRDVAISSFDINTNTPRVVSLDSRIESNLPTNWSVCDPDRTVLRSTRTRVALGN